MTLAATWLLVTRIPIQDDIGKARKEPKAPVGNIHCHHGINNVGLKSRGCEFQEKLAN